MKLKLNTAKDLFADQHYARKADEAAQALASVNKDDPFLYDRMMNELKQRLRYASDVQDEANRLIAAREKQLAEEAPNREATALALKKHFGLVPMGATA